MKAILFLLAVLVLSLEAAAQAPASTPATAKPPSWKAAYFFDQDFSSLVLNDVYFPGPRCAMALGVQFLRGKGKAVALRSVDGGVNWTTVALKSYARSAYFASERMGWIVTEDGIARTGDCGLTFEKVSGEKNLARVWFRDEALGWAVGTPKKALATRDGGKTWTPIKPESDPGSEPSRSVYAWVEFANEKFGVMAGWHTPKRNDVGRFPVWMDPEAAQIRRQWPSLTLLLQTTDGGVNWKGFTASLMGRMTRLRMKPDGTGLALIEFDESFEYPAEVYRMGVGNTQIARIYRDKTHAVTDMAQTSDGWIYLAGVQMTSSMRLPIPGKVRILRSRDGRAWTEDPVDYRANGNRVHLAVSPQGQMLAVTDTGMILKLQ